MDFLSLPDEMCANALKYSSIYTILQCRRISKRLNNITTRFDLNRVPVDRIEGIGSVILESHLVKERNSIDDIYWSMREIWREAKTFCPAGYPLKPLNDGKDYQILQIRVFFEGKNISEKSGQEDRWFCRRLTEDLNKYQAIDELLKKFRCVNSVIIGRKNLLDRFTSKYENSYEKELDECLCRNNNTLRAAKNVEFYCPLPIEPSYFQFYRKLNNLQYISLGHVPAGFEVDKMLSDFDGGLGLDLRLPRSPETIGDSFLRKWMNKLPKRCNISGQNNFTLSLFKKLLLKLIDSGFTNTDYNFGALASKKGDVEELQSFLGDNKIPYTFKYHVISNWEFNIYVKGTGTEICFELDKEPI